MALKLAAESLCCQGQMIWCHYCTVYHNSRVSSFCLPGTAALYPFWDFGILYLLNCCLSPLLGWADRCCSLFYLGYLTYRG